MLADDVIAHQKKLLHTHRQNLDYGIYQLNHSGGLNSAHVSIIHQIEQECDHIRKIITTLHENNIPVDSHPYDNYYEKEIKTRINPSSTETGRFQSTLAQSRKQITFSPVLMIISLMIIAIGVHYSITISALEHVNTYHATRPYVPAITPQNTMESSLIA